MSDRTIAALLLALCAGCATLTPEEVVARRAEWHSLGRLQTSDEAALEEGTGAWTVTLEQEGKESTETWIVVRSGDELYVEPRSHGGRERCPFWLSVPGASRPEALEWTLEKPGSGEPARKLSFDPTFAAFQVEYRVVVPQATPTYQPNLKFGENLVVSVLANLGKETSYEVHGSGARAEWPPAP